MFDDHESSLGGGHEEVGGEHLGSTVGEADALQAGEGDDEGVGKSHLLIALGTEAAIADHRVKYVLATKLVNELVEAADEKQLTKTIARYGIETGTASYRLATARARAEQQATS